MSEPAIAATVTPINGDDIAQSLPFGAYDGGYHGAGAAVGAVMLRPPGIAVASREAANEVVVLL